MADVTYISRKSHVPVSMDVQAMHNLYLNFAV